MPSGWWSRAVGATCRVSARLRRVLPLVFLCLAVSGLPSATEVTPAAAQTIDCAQSSAALIRDCETLLGLKDALRGSASLNWAGNLPLSSWEGVGSDAEEGVWGLVLNGKGLTGTIPAALGDLSSLDTLYLYDNQLSGSIPAELGHLRNLRSIFFHNNQLSGSIPPQLGLSLCRTCPGPGRQLTIPAALET